MCCERLSEVGRRVPQVNIQRFEFIFIRAEISFKVNYLHVFAQPAFLAYELLHQWPNRLRAEGCDGLF